jgi:hypothetical protein
MITFHQVYKKKVAQKNPPFQQERIKPDKKEFKNTMKNLN